MEQQIYLIGFMGSGKSTVTRRLGRLTGAAEIEMDAQIVKESGMSINDMFEQYGEQYFRDKETELLRRIASGESAIVSCGGGTVMRPENVDIMKKSGRIILLSASPETIFQRVRHSKDRPILNGNMNVEFIRELMEKRRPAYEGACDVRVETDGRTPDEIAEAILKKVQL